MSSPYRIGRTLGKPSVQPRWRACRAWCESQLYFSSVFNLPKQVYLKETLVENVVQCEKGGLKIDGG